MRGRKGPNDGQEANAPSNVGNCEDDATSYCEELHMNLSMRCVNHVFFRSCFLPFLQCRVVVISCSCAPAAGILIDSDATIDEDDSEWRQGVLE